MYILVRSLFHEMEDRPLTTTKKIYPLSFEDIEKHQIKSHEETSPTELSSLLIEIELQIINNNNNNNNQCESYKDVILNFVHILKITNKKTLYLSSMSFDVIGFCIFVSPNVIIRK